MVYTIRDYNHTFYSLIWRSIILILNDGGELQRQSNTMKNLALIAIHVPLKKTVADKISGHVFTPILYKKTVIHDVSNGVNKL